MQNHNEERAATHSQPPIFQTAKQGSIRRGLRDLEVPIQQSFHGAGLVKIVVRDRYIFDF